ncbi:MAG TPA: sulfotransferase [Acidimicrobiales bacterium]|nr:sulfotransferase [Acidimicrobiales bacterium]
MPVDLMIVGSQKSGTTSLLAYLARHPAITAQIRPEMTWFSDADLAGRPFPTDFYFGADVGDGRLRLGKLAGLMYHAEAVRRLREHNPTVRTIAILREPVGRAYSSYWHARRRGHEPIETFEDAIHASADRFGDARNVERWDYLGWSSYAPYIERLQETFGADAVHVAIFEEFAADPATTVVPLLASCGLDGAGLGRDMPSENSGGRARSKVLSRLSTHPAVKDVTRRLLPMSIRAAFRRQYRRVNEVGFRPPPIGAGVERELRIYFEEPNARLEALIGRPIQAWREGAAREVDAPDD